MMRSLGAALALTALVLAGPAAAQALAPLEETPEARRKAYAEEARGLALVLGSSHYLRVLCDGRGDQSWRNFMRDFLDREAAMRRSVLIDAFNEGYRDTEARFPACGPAARQEEAALKAQGLRLADTLAARNGD
jgi:uncharacterized protein (TIGR02301 family)